MTYANIILYGAVIPSMKTSDKKKKGAEEQSEDTGEAVDGDDPANWEDIKNFYRKKKKH